MKLNRIILYTKDIVSLTGRTERHARAVMAAIRRGRGKEPRQPVSVQDYCRYTGISEEEVVKHLTGR